MIKLTDKISEPKIINAELLKIKLTFDAYSDIALFWRQEDTGCVISMLDGNMVIYAPEGTDFDELYEFIGVISPRSIFTSHKVAEKLQLQGIQKAAVMFKTADGGQKGRCDALSSDELYKFLLSGGFTLPEYPDFAVDICHRVNHGLACVFALRDGFAAVCFNTDNFCLINGIVSFKKGMGSRALSQISAEHKGKTIIACCEENVCGFYTKNGFKHLYDTAYWEAK